MHHDERLRTATLPCSPSPFTILIKSRRRSSVNGGSGTRIVVPAEDGLNPNLRLKLLFLPQKLKNDQKQLQLKYAHLLPLRLLIGEVESPHHNTQLELHQVDLVVHDQYGFRNMAF